MPVFKHGDKVPEVTSPGHHPPTHAYAYAKTHNTKIFERETTFVVDAMQIINKIFHLTH
jgi:hypothetical protein